jgi:hypothetical protein
MLPASDRDACLKTEAGLPKTVKSSTASGVAFAMVSFTYRQRTGANSANSTF